jgi:hypothetical protein
MLHSTPLTRISSSRFKLKPGVVRVFTAVCLLFPLYVQLPNVDELRRVYSTSSDGPSRQNHIYFTLALLANSGDLVGDNS